MNIVCKNLKIRLILKRCIDLTKRDNDVFSIEHKTNSCIIRSHFLRCVLTVYKHSLMTVHATGIKDKNTINEVLEFLKDFQSCEIEKILVDNSLFSGKAMLNVDPIEIKDKLSKRYAFYSASFAQDIFPAMFLRPGLKYKSDFATILLFKNSKFIIIGSKSLQSIKNTLDVMLYLTTC